MRCSWVVRLKSRETTGWMWPTTMALFVSNQTPRPPRIASYGKHIYGRPTCISALAMPFAWCRRIVQTVDLPNNSKTVIQHQRPPLSFSAPDYRVLYSQAWSSRNTVRKCDSNRHSLHSACVFAKQYTPLSSIRRGGHTAFPVANGNAGRLLSYREGGGISLVFFL